MHRLALIVVVATGCDQGAKAPPPSPPAVESHVPARPPIDTYAIRTDDEYSRQTITLVEDFVRLFGDGSKDCEVIATRVETWAAQNVTRLGRIQDYAKAHPDVRPETQNAQVAARMKELVEPMMPVITTCASNQRLVTALMKINSPQQPLLQRPR